jgi:hypothetical protein
MNKNKMNSIVILFLMIITGFIIYYMYLKPESFDCITNPSDPACIAPTARPTARPTSILTNYCPNNPTDAACIAYCVANPTDPMCVDYCNENPTDPNCIASAANAANAANDRGTTEEYDTITNPASIISRYFGVGFNIYPVVSSLKTYSAYLIEHIPITPDGVVGGCYSLSSDGLFTIKIKNNDDSSQWWTITSTLDSENNPFYEIVQPFNNNNMALQYANGNLSITPYTFPGFESQKWVKSNNTVTRGIPVLNMSPSSMFTTEFDPYSTSNSISTNLTDANNIQVNNVINAVKTGIQQYLNKVNPSSQITSSSLGNKNMPLSVNLNLNSSAAAAAAAAADDNSTQGISFFDNVTGSTSSNDILSMLNKYDSNTNSQSIYTTDSLENQLNRTNNGCKLFNINDYMSNRVSTCNCKI